MAQGCSGRAPPPGTDFLHSTMASAMPMTDSYRPRVQAQSTVSCLCPEPSNCTSRRERRASLQSSVCSCRSPAGQRSRWGGPSHTVQPAAYPPVRLSKRSRSKAGPVLPRKSPGQPAVPKSRKRSGASKGSSVQQVRRPSSTACPYLQGLRQGPLRQLPGGVAKQLRGFLEVTHKKVHLLERKHNRTFPIKG